MHPISRLFGTFAFRRAGVRGGTADGEREFRLLLQFVPHEHAAPMRPDGRTTDQRQAIGRG